MPTPNEPNKTKISGQTFVQRKNNSGQRNEGPTGDTSPLQKSIESLPIITKDQRKTGRVT